MCKVQSGLSRPLCLSGISCKLAWSVSMSVGMAHVFGLLIALQMRHLLLLYAPPRIISWSWTVSSRHHIAYRAIFIPQCRLSSSAGTLTRSDRHGVLGDVSGSSFGSFSASDLTSFLFPLSCKHNTANVVRRCSPRPSGIQFRVITRNVDIPSLP
jgi:hypothetical protein